MTGRVCPDCGATNAAEEQFCTSCGVYLWTSGTTGATGTAGPPGTAGTPGPASGPTGDRGDPPGSGPTPGNADGPSTQVIRGAGTWWSHRSRQERSRQEPPESPAEVTVVDRTGARPPAVTVVDGDVVLADARHGTVTLRVRNRSKIVEGYRVEPVAPPPWLTTTVPKANLLPEKEEVLRVELGVRPGPLVLAQRLPLRLDVRADSTPRALTPVTVTVIVPPVGGPARIRTEPAVVRVKDARHGRFTVHLDNAGCNHPRRYVLSGGDDESVVRFGFAPAVVDVPADGSAAVAVRVEAPQPGPGERGERALRVRAAPDGGEAAAPGAVLDATVRLLQESSAAPADAPVRLRLEPSVLRTGDDPGVELRLVVDNRGGSRDRRVRLDGGDPERRIAFAFGNPELWVPAGTERATSVRLRAPVPAPGEQTSRPFTVTAHDGRDTSEVSGTWTQTASAAPIVTAAIRLEPEQVRVRDRYDGRTGVVVDNRRGVRPLRVRLSGSDPEGTVRFDFRPPVLDVGPGRTGRAELVVSAPLPPPGEEAVRSVRVRATDGHGTVEADGSIHHSASASPISTARLLLEPQRVVSDAGSARLRVRLENRSGAGPVAVRLRAADPERAIRWDFRPPVLEVAPGGVGWAELRLRAPRPGGGRTVTRPFTVAADAVDGSVEAAGELVQSAADRRPLLRVLLTVLGALLLAVGAFQPWTDGDGAARFAGVDTVPASVREAVGAEVTGVEGAAAVVQTLQPVERTLLLLVAALMVFGLTGPKGRLTRLCGLVAVLSTIAAATLWQLGGLGLAPGLVLVVLGGVVGFVGGLIVRR